MYRYFILFAVAICVHFSPKQTFAQYVISLTAEVQGQEFHGLRDLSYTFIPGIFTSENGSASDAFVTFSSPTGRNKGFHNHPERFTASRRDERSVEALLNEANGTWRVSVEDDNSLFEYEVDIDFTLPFDQIPFFTSTTLLNENPLEPFSWSLEGGSAEYPGRFARLFASLDELDSNGVLQQRVDDVNLPIDATSWAPTVGNTTGDQFLAAIYTDRSAFDNDAFNITEIRSLTSGAPELTFLFTRATYSADYRAILTGSPVPEPSSVGLVSLVTVGLIGGRRFKKSIQKPENAK